MSQKLKKFTDEMYNIFGRHHQHFLDYCAYIEHSNNNMNIKDYIKYNVCPDKITVDLDEVNLTYAEIYNLIDQYNSNAYNKIDTDASRLIDKLYNEYTVINVRTNDDLELLAINLQNVMTHFEKKRCTKYDSLNFHKSFEYDHKIYLLRHKIIEPMRYSLFGFYWHRYCHCCPNTASDTEPDIEPIEYIKTGPVIIKHDNGRIKAKFSRLNSRRHGLYEEWHANGQLNRICFYNKGLLNGPLKSFYAAANNKKSNSKLAINRLKHINFKNGFISGLYCKWSFIGRLVKYVYYLTVRKSKKDLKDQIDKNVNKTSKEIDWTYMPYNALDQVNIKIFDLLKGQFAIINRLVIKKKIRYINKIVISLIDSIIKLGDPCHIINSYFTFDDKLLMR